MAKSTVKNYHVIYLGDPRDMAGVNDGVARLAVTSLPYLDNENEEGNGGFDFSAYVLDLALVWSECMRALHPGGRLCVHLKGGAGKFFTDLDNRPRAVTEALSSSCHAAGFEYEATIVRHRETGKSLAFQFPGSSVLPREMSIRGDVDCIMIYGKPGDPPEAPSGSKGKSRMSKKEAGRLGSVLWSFPDSGSDGFPEEIPKRLIKMYSFVGESVLDPFAGGGAVCAAARDLGRSSIGYEHDESREEEIRKRVEGTSGIKNFSIEKAEPADEKKIQKQAAEIKKKMKLHVSALPSPARGQKSGSSTRKPQRQSQSQRKPQPQRQTQRQPEKKNKEESVTFTQVYNVDHLRKEDGRDVKLLGIEVPAKFFSRNPGLYRQSMDFLKRAVEGKKLRVRMPDSRGGAYIYVDQRVTVNEQLIRAGYALSDKNATHEMRKKFDRFEKEAKDHDMGMWALKKTDKPR
ncbi:DNA methyltransferase [bacterium]